MKWPSMLNPLMPDSLMWDDGPVSSLPGTLAQEVHTQQNDSGGGAFLLVLICLLLFGGFRKRGR